MAVHYRRVAAEDAAGSRGMVLLLAVCALWALAQLLHDDRDGDEHFHRGKIGPALCRC